MPNHSEIYIMLLCICIYERQYHFVFPNHPNFTIHCFCSLEALPIYDSREPHLHALKHVLRYIQGTISQSLQLHASTSSDLIAYSNTDCGDTQPFGDPPSGYYVYMRDNIILCSLKHQGIISRSSLAEYCGVRFLREL